MSMAWPTSERIAVCIAGEQRSASCPPRDTRTHGSFAPLESIANFLAALDVPLDVFVVLDANPKAEEPGSSGASVGASLLESTIRTKRSLDRIRPVAIAGSS